MKLSIKTAEAIAERWKVCSRTIYAWKADGVDLNDELAVCERIVNSKHPSRESLNAALSTIKKLETAKP